MKIKSKILIGAAIIVALVVYYFLTKNKSEKMSNNINQPFEPKNFTLKDAEIALREIARMYGNETAKMVERVYRWETAHFKSRQYVRTGSPGAEAVKGSTAPNYGWSPSFGQKYPQHLPVGIWSSLENPGMSAQGGNEQSKEPKRFMVFPSVLSAMIFFVEYVNRQNGNFARWYSTDATRQQLYREQISKVRPRIVESLT